MEGIVVGCLLSPVTTIMTASLMPALAPSSMASLRADNHICVFRYEGQGRGQEYRGEGERKRNSEVGNWKKSCRLLNLKEKIRLGLHL